MAGGINALPLVEAKIKIEFAVSRDSEGNIGFPIAGAHGSGNIDFSKASRSSLEVTFGRP